MKKNRKKGMIATDIIAYLIIALVIFIILLRFGGAILQLAKGSGEDFGCTLSAVLNAYTKIYGSSTFKLNCPVETFTLKHTDLNQALTEKEQKYLAAELKKDPKELSRDISETTKNYQLSKFMAQKMKSCWNKLGRGEMPLFSQKWTPITNNEDLYEEYKANIAERFLSSLTGLYYQSAPTVCVVCSTIIFDETLPETMLNKKHNIDPFLQNNPANPGFLQSQKSFYEYFLDDPFKHTAFTPSYTFTPKTDEPLAVVFTRTNAFYLVEVKEDIKDIFGGDSSEENGFAGVDNMALVPYSELRKIKNSDGRRVGLCDQIAG